MVMTVGRYLMGQAEIADRLGVSRQRVYQLTSGADWPKPYDELATGRVWRIEDVEAWISTNRPDLVRTDAEPAPARRKGCRGDARSRRKRATGADEPTDA